MKHLELFENFNVGETLYIYEKDGWILGVKDRKIKKVEDFNIRKDMSMLITNDENRFEEIKDFIVVEEERWKNKWSVSFDEDEFDMSDKDPIVIKFEDKLMTKPGSMKVKEEYLSQYKDLKGFTKTKVFVGMMAGDLNF